MRTNQKRIALGTLQRMHKVSGTLDRNTIYQALAMGAFQHCEESSLLYPKTNKISVMIFESCEEKGQNLQDWLLSSFSEVEVDAEIFITSCKLEAQEWIHSLRFDLVISKSCGCTTESPSLFEEYKRSSIQEGSRWVWSDTQLVSELCSSEKKSVISKPYNEAKFIEMMIGMVYPN